MSKRESGTAPGHHQRVVTSLTSHKAEGTSTSPAICLYEQLMRANFCSQARSSTVRQGLLEAGLSWRWADAPTYGLIYPRRVNGLVAASVRTGFDGSASLFLLLNSHVFCICSHVLLAGTDASGFQVLYFSYIYNPAIP